LGTANVAFFLFRPLFFSKKQATLKLPGNNQQSSNLPFQHFNLPTF